MDEKYRLHAWADVMGYEKQRAKNESMFDIWARSDFSRYLVSLQPRCWFFRALRRIEDARKKWPIPEEMRESYTLQTNREEGYLSREVFAVVDGERLPCEAHKDPDLQNAYYEGYTSTVEITNLLVYNFKKSTFMLRSTIPVAGMIADYRLFPD